MAQPNNFLSPINFKFTSSETPNMEYLVQSVILPGMELGTAIQPTPFVRLTNPGNISYGDLYVTFKMDEELLAFNEIFDWMERLGHPDNLDTQYSYLKSDLRVIVMSSSVRPMMDFTYTDCYPTNISPLSFDSTLTDVNYISTTVGFTFNRIIRNSTY